MLAKTTKPCGACTKCCEGYLWGEAYGHQFRLGKKCGWLSQGKCIIYPNHPEHPCKSFVCEWKSNSDWPQWLRPDLAKVIFIQRQTQSHVYYLAVQCDEYPSKDIHDWALDHSRKHNQTLVIPESADKSIVYTQDFACLDSLRNHFKNSNLSWRG